MATVLDKAIKNINVPKFENLKFDLGTCTLPKTITKVDLFLELKRKEKQEQDQKIEDLCKELDNYPDTTIDKETIKKCIIKDRAHFKLQTYIKFVDELPGSYEKSLKYSWENVAVYSLDTGCTVCRTGLRIQMFRMNIPAFWAQKNGSKRIFFEHTKYEGDKRYSKIQHDSIQYTDPQEVHDRNYSIAENRYKYFSKTKRGPKSHEMQANYYYENDEAYQQFLKEVEEKGLSKKIEYRAKSEIYGFNEGFFHKVTLPKEKFKGEQGFTDKDLEKIEKMNLSELGGIENELYDKRRLSSI